MVVAEPRGGGQRWETANASWYSMVDSGRREVYAEQELVFQLQSSLFQVKNRVSWSVISIFGYF
jgi:hypothetical protein